MAANLATVLFDGARRGYRHDGDEAEVPRGVAGLLLDAAQQHTYGRLRHYGDEALHRAALAAWREEVNAAEALPGLVDACGEARGAVRLIEWCLFLGQVRRRIAEEEAFRERARARGVPRDDRRGWVPEGVVAAVKGRLDLAALILSWGLTDLRPLAQGRWVGRCPFHEDREPSFYVFASDPADQHYHCHGCGAHGDAFDLARAHGPWLSFGERVAGLAAVAGVDWPPPEPAPRRATTAPRRPTTGTGGRVRLRSAGAGG